MTTSAAGEPHKILAWKEPFDGRMVWRGHQLMPLSQVRSLLAALSWKFEVFATIQNYDAAGNCLGSPLYFDLDNTDQSKVLADARQLVSSLEFLVNVTPRIFFSGTKGFHLLIDYVVEHPRCHLVVQELAREAALGLGTAKNNSLDMAVYRSFSMFRVNCSPASTPGYFKTEITRDELFSLEFSQIRELARAQRFIDVGHTSDAIDNSLMDDWLAEVLARLPRYDDIGVFETRHQSLGQDFTPCLRQMLRDGVDQGRRNEAAFVLAKFFKLAGLDEESTLELFLAHEPWKAFEREGREVTKVVRSVQRNHKPPMIGCRGASQNAELMRAYCSNLCFLRTDMVELTAIDERVRA